MLNSNPETVSTDYDTSDRLYFEPLTVEDVLSVCEVERPEGIIVQFGGQTPLSLATKLEAALKANPIQAASGNGVTHILGTPPDLIDAAEDRTDGWISSRELDIRQPSGGVCIGEGEALSTAERVGYPVMVRPSYVLGGRAMEVVSTPSQLKIFGYAVEVDPGDPVLVINISTKRRNWMLMLCAILSVMSLSVVSWNISSKLGCTLVILRALCRAKRFRNQL